jgi:hypothetical protein
MITVCETVYCVMLSFVVQSREYDTEQRHVEAQAIVLHRLVI